MVGNEFILPQPRLQVAAPAVTLEPVVSTSIVPVEATPQPELIPVTVITSREPVLSRFVDLLHQYSIGVFALLFLLVGAAGIQVGNRYWTAGLESSIPALNVA